MRSEHDSIIDQLKSALRHKLVPHYTTSVVFDNDALNEILTDDDHLTAFAKFVNTENVEINIPSDVVMEFTTGKPTIDGNEQAGVIYRIQQLRKFVGELDEYKKIRFNLPFPIQAHSEIARPKRRSRRIPSVLDITRTMLLGAQDVTDVVNEVQRMAERRKQAAKRLERQDRAVRNSKLFDPRIVIEQIRGFRENGVKITLRSLLIHQTVGMDLTGNLISRIITSRNRYPILNAFYDLLALHHVVVLIQRDQAPEDILPMLPLHKNDRPDLFVSAMAAQQHFFVTCDSTLAARCTFLKSQSVLQFETIKLVN